MRRNSLPGRSCTNRYVQLSLSRLPAYHWRRVYTRCLCAGESIQNHEGFTALLFHHERNGWSEQARVLPECGSGLFGGATEQGQGITAASLDDPSLFKPQM